MHNEKRNPVSNDTGNEYVALRAIEKRNFKTDASGYDFPMAKPKAQLQNASARKPLLAIGRGFGAR
jgi:hypothetical protein